MALYSQKGKGVLHNFLAPKFLTNSKFLEWVLRLRKSKKNGNSWIPTRKLTKNFRSHFFLSLIFCIMLSQTMNRGTVCPAEVFRFKFFCIVILKTYKSSISTAKHWFQWGSNPWPFACKANVITTTLWNHGILESVILTVSKCGHKLSPFEKHLDYSFIEK